MTWSAPRTPRTYCLILAVIVSLSGFPAGAEPAPASVSVYLPDRAFPGDVVRIIVDGEEITGVSVEITTPHVGTVQAAGFPAGTAPSGLERWQILLGISHTTSVGEGAVVVAVETGRGREQYGGPLLIEPRTFREEEIRLNSALTDLRRTEDPRRERESRELWNLLHQIDPRGGHHRERLVKPVDDYRRTSTYGDRRIFLYSDGEMARAWHNGLDMAAPTGTPVRAPGRGRVVMAAERLVTGGTIVLEHQPGVYSLYYHLDSVDVGPDMIVDQGEVIGTVGATGLATGPHLHWEVRVGGVAVDPEFFLEHPLVDMEGITGALSPVP